VSRRSFGGSSGTYYGLRTVCDQCKFARDHPPHEPADVTAWTVAAILVGIIVVRLLTS
jgi:hypothetical protein